MIVPYPHADHLGQFDQVLDAFDVAKVWWSGNEVGTQTFANAQAALEAAGAAYLEPRVGQSKTVGVDTSRCTAPSAAERSDRYPPCRPARVTKL